MKIQIKSIDTLIFRDGRPFGSDNDSWANSLTFPSLTSIYGALRAIYFSQNPNEIDFANKKNDPTKDLKIKGVYFYKDDEGLLFPLPKDLVYDKKERRLISLSIIKNKNSNNPLEYIFTSDKEIENKEGFLGEIAFLAYLNQDDNKFSFCENSNFILEESKIGIGRNNNTKSVDEGRLYRVGLKRYKNLSFIIDFEGIEIKKEGLLRFGGEGKGAYYTEYNEINLIKCKDLEGDIFKLILLTPAIFQQGWIPDFIDRNNFEGNFDGIDVKLIAAAVGKAEYIGGWDIQENKPKPMFKAIPAGSVYYFKLQKPSDKEKVIDVFNYKSITNFQNYKNEGYGICVVGNYKGEIK